jgi:hypothetical protein
MLKLTGSVTTVSNISLAVEQGSELIMTSSAKAYLTFFLAFSLESYNLGLTCLPRTLNSLKIQYFGLVYIISTDT